MDATKVDIETLFDSLSIKDLLKCRVILNNTIEKALVNDREKVKSVSANDYVTHQDKFVDTEGELFKGLLNDVAKTKLQENSTADNKVSNMWISKINQPYTWVSKSTNKTFSFDPQSFTDYPNIIKLCDLINQQNDSQLNSCLISFYPTGKAAINLHADNEETMDNNEPISVFSIGTSRTIEFVKKYESSTSIELTVVGAEGSLYTMSPKCQDYMRHRVKTNNSIKSWRVCLSFRHMLNIDELKSSSKCVHIDTNQVDNSFSLLSLTLSKAQKKVAANDDNNSQQCDSSKKASVKRDSNVDGGGISLRRSRRYEHGMTGHNGTTVLFGTSMSVNLKSDQLRDRSNNFVNLSKSGAKIQDITNIVDNFYFSHSLAGDVQKIIFNFGTNDIKLERHGVFKFQEPVFNLFSKTRNLFPNADIYIIPTLPMKNLYRYTVNNILNFNSILGNAAKHFGCVYVDCFRYFLTHDLCDINKFLYCWDGIHFNMNGLDILGNWVYHIIHYTTYNTDYISSLNEFL